MTKRWLLLPLMCFFLACGQDKARHYERDYTSSYTRNMDSINRQQDTLAQEGGEELAAEPAAESSVSSTTRVSTASTDDGRNESSDDNMRGFDPLSEDDTDDNGMSRYMENTDEEGWD